MSERIIVTNKMKDHEARSANAIMIGDIVLPVAQTGKRPLTSEQSGQLLNWINQQLDTLDGIDLNSSTVIWAAIVKARLEGVRAGMMFQQGRFPELFTPGIKIFDILLHGRRR